ncbi:MAG TPA: DinB family protein [Gemmatimonadaceae bacterium]
MKGSRFLIVALAAPISLAAQQPSAGLPPNPITTAFKTRIAGQNRNILQAFDSIPESKFSYKPTPAQLSIGFVAAHITNDNYFFCNNLGALKGTRPAADTATADSVKATWPKAQLMTSLRESFTFCDQAINQLDDAKLAEPVTITFGGNSRTVARANMVLGHAIDLADHYSQLANYMRLNNILPPTALPRPRPAGN